MNALLKVNKLFSQVEEASGLQTVEDSGAEGAAEAPREGGEALEQGGRWWSSLTDTKECLSAEGRRMPW